MPMKPLSRSLAFALALLSVGAASAQQQPRPEQLIKWRQSAFQVVAWNASRIKANLDAGYDRQQVLKSATAIAAIANAGLGALFAPGTETGKGWHDTAARPELFAAGSRVGELNAAFAREAGELARIVPTADEAAVKEQFGKLQKTCKSCHDDYRVAN